ncbi:triose-phosphate isomerase [Microbacterium sp. Root180]|uniref:triose-phosphate isomerase n=1 Tax=Microbacterium sp. Root180 TaxID=1736483 RepID=UPI000A83BA23|nr:triose-phosphate isomerase [Microbacterium sp. Root180]
MSADSRLSAPFFEIGPKNLLRLPAIIEVALAAVRAGDENGVSVIVTVPAPLIAQVQRAVPDVFVFAQTMDDDEPGPSVGRITAESLVDAGARGVMLNHDSSPLDPTTLARTVRRASESGLMTMVCAGTDEQALDLARLDPTIVLYEPPELIGGAGGGDRPWIRPIDRRVREVAPEVLMMHAGGVAVPEDAYRIMRSGAQGTGSTSGVLRAASPTDAAAQFIRAARRGYDEALSAGG